MSTSVAPAKLLAGQAPQKPATNYLVLNRADLLKNLNTHSCWVHHKLCDHPLFELPRLLKLAKTLPEKYVRINSGAVAVGATPDQIPGTGQTVEQSFQQIIASNTRIMLKHIELDAEYRELLHSCIDEIAAVGHVSMRDIAYRVGYVFISAPNQTTPYHMDPEINFLLQIRGQKTFNVLPGDDRSILSEEDIELFYSGRHHSLRFDESWHNRATPYVMEPGAGVHIPVNHPHWVTTANEVTISFALTLETAETQRRGMICAFNDRLRRWGITPTPFGRSPTRDFLKHQTFRVLSGLKSLFRGGRQAAAH